MRTHTHTQKKKKEKKYYLPQQPEMVGERTHTLDYSQHGRVKKPRQLGRANPHRVCQDCFS